MADAIRRKVNTCTDPQWDDMLAIYDRSADEERNVRLSDVAALFLSEGRISIYINEMESINIADVPTVEKVSQLINVNDAVSIAHSNPQDLVNSPVVNDAVSIAESTSMNYDLFASPNTAVSLAESVTVSVA